MRKQNLIPYSIRVFSLFSMTLSLVLLSGSNRKGTIKVPENDLKSSKIFLYTGPVLQTQKPPFDYTVISLFSKNNENGKKKTIPAKKTAVKQTIIPSLSFIGTVETGNKRIYSFKNTDTQKLLLLEKGIKNDRITIVGDDGTTCTLKINDHTFQVEKK